MYAIYALFLIYLRSCRNTVELFLTKKGIVNAMVIFLCDCTGKIINCRFLKPYFNLYNAYTVQGDQVAINHTTENK